MFKLSLISVAGLLLAPLLWGRVIYGEDQRVEVAQSSALQQRVATAAATLIHKSDLHQDQARSGELTVSARTLRQWLESQFGDKARRKLLGSSKLVEATRNGVTFCDGERFVDQPNPGMCSGFLIGPDLLVTAGHCVEVPGFCEEFRWVFGFVTGPEGAARIRERDVYSCKRVVSNLLSMPLGLDYAIIQLDRPVVERAPVTIAEDSRLTEADPLFVVGSPSGLPLKVAGGASVRKNTHPFYFSANLDTFQGNSGSGVYNALTGKAEGILVRGEEDYTLNSARNCIEAKRCANDACRGEDVTRLTAVPEIGLRRSFVSAAEAGEVGTLEKLLRLNFWIDFYTHDGQSALLKAVQAGQAQSLEVLLKNGADAGLRDARGNSVYHLVRDPRLVPQLNSALALINVTNSLGLAPLKSAADRRDLSVVKALIAAGADKNIKDANGETILFTFARNGDWTSVRELIALGIDPGIRNKNSESVFDLKN